RRVLFRSQAGIRLCRPAAPGHGRPAGRRQPPHRDPPAGGRGMRSALASLRPLLVATLTVAAVLARPAVAQEDPALSPYVMLRSLQFVQDSVVLGDHSAGEMQRFMLEKIDQRLRNVDMAVFEDTRNVDAALIYAMSGGNPATLEYLVDRDVA